MSNVSPVIVLGVLKQNLDRQETESLEELVRKNVFVEFEGEITGYSLYEGNRDFSLATSDIMIMQNQFNRTVSDYPSPQEFTPTTLFNLNEKHC